MTRVLLLALAIALLAAAPASASQLVTIDTPSANVDPARVKFNGPEPQGRLQANVLLPDGFDARRDYPVLYLLHGAGDSFASWAQPDKGDVQEIAAGLQAIVVMPEADTGFYADWWNGGRRGDPGWERFYLDELIPLIERRFPIRPGRRWHAIAGLSMGGLGATFLASQLPGYFGSAASFSGFVEHQRPEAEQGLPVVAGVAYEDIFGPGDGFYAAGHNPTRLIQNLRQTRVFAASGDGVADRPVSPQEAGLGGLVEREIRLQNDEFAQAAQRAGVDLTYRPAAGVHAWPYWRDHLRQALAWDLFAPVPEDPVHWSYTTVARRGDAWGLRYAFASPPEQLETLRRAGDGLTGEGAGSVRIENAAGCGFTADLPFEHPLPPATCAAAKRKHKRHHRRHRRRHHRRHHRRHARS
jgi:S-formylglutathione hydrolase FrmB